VQNASSGDTINLDAGTYTNNVTNITINKNLTIQGKNPKTTIIDAQNLGRIFITTSGITLTLINITLINANDTTYGGAIDNNGNLSIRNCEFINNTATIGGGAIYAGGVVTITDSNFTTNTARSGGAILGAGVVNITNSNFNSNTATDGGGIYQSQNNINITNSSFINNTAIRNGGAVILLNVTDMTINNTIFKNNIAELGSSIYKDSVNFLGIPTNLTVINSNFTDNKGGATIYLTSRNINITGNTTITGSNIFNNTQGILISNNSSAIINYNRIFNNTNNTGFDLDDGSIGSDLDFNWWGDNTPQVNGTLNNYFIMNVTNATSLNSNGTVIFDYTFRLNTGESADNSLLPYFVTNVYTNVTSGVIESFDARFDRLVTITVNTTGAITYTFITDNEIQNLEGFIEEEPPIPPEPPEPPEPTPTPENNENNNNPTTNITASMKKTGIPILALLGLLSLLGFIRTRKF
jgi:predicted outer membrane repeat protein